MEYWKNFMDFIRKDTLSSSSTLSNFDSDESLACQATLKFIFDNSKQNEIHQFFNEIEMVCVL